MKSENISLLEGRKVAQAIDYLVDIFKSDVMPKDLIIDILIIMRKMAMSGSIPYDVVNELSSTLEKAINESLEKLTAPEKVVEKNHAIDPIEKPAQMQRPKEIMKASKTEVIKQTIAKLAPVPRIQKIVTLDEKDMPEKSNGNSQILRKGEIGKTCKTESKLTFSIANTRLSLFLDMIANSDFAVNESSWDKALIEEVEKIRRRIFSHPTSTPTIILVEKEKSISIKDEDYLYGLTFMAGDSSSLFIWTRDDRICPWNKPETTPLEDLMSTEGIEPTDLRCIVMAKSPVGEKIEIDFIKFVK